MIPLFFITILIFYIIFKSIDNLYKNKNFVEPYAADMPVLKLRNLYLKRINEMKDPDNVLKREIIEDKENNIIKPYINKNSNTFQKIIEVDNFNVDKQLYIQKLLEKIKNNCVLKNKELFKRDDGFYYYDHRFPEQLIPIEFALNPKLFIEKNPKVYPSFVLLK